MDQTDIKILRLLQKDATCSVAEIAEQVNLSVTPCWRRIQKLKDDGVIARNAVLLDPKALGLNLTVFVSIKTNQHNAKWTDNLINAVMSLPNVVEFYRMAGISTTCSRSWSRTWRRTTGSTGVSSKRSTCWTSAPAFRWKSSRAPRNCRWTLCRGGAERVQKFFAAGVRRERVLPGGACQARHLAR